MCFYDVIWGPQIEDQLRKLPDSLKQLRWYIVYLGVFRIARRRQRQRLWIAGR